MTNNLEQFYWNEVVSKLSHEDRNHAFMIIDDVVVVNFDSIYVRECSLRGPDQLLYLLHQTGQGRRFLFLSEDGAILRYCGAIPIIENVINCFNLNKDTCYVMCREYIKIPNATVINNNFLYYWCNTIWQTVKDIELQQGQLSKKFAVWFNRGTFYRLQLMQHLYKFYKDDSFISYQESGMLVEKKLEEYFTESLDWANQHTPVIYDKLFENRVYNYEDIVGISRKPYEEYFVEIVGESHIIDNAWITEKTVKNLYIGKPFLVYSGPYSLELLRKNGFKTFSPWIDESYDTIVNSYERLEAIKKEIDRLANLTYEELNDLQKEMMPVLVHNRENFLKFIYK